VGAKARTSAAGAAETEEESESERPSAGAGWACGRTGRAYWRAVAELRHQLTAFLRHRLPPSAPPTARWHALRRGVVTTSAFLGDDSPSRKRRGRWRSSATARQYARPVRPHAHPAPADGRSDSDSSSVSAAPAADVLAFAPTATF
jgi:hypothetical protein